jgi:hypothetical protein
LSNASRVAAVIFDDEARAQPNVGDGQLRVEPDFLWDL